jgi:hypothetical protein
MAVATAADILIRHPNGSLVAAVDVESRGNLTVGLAMTLRLSRINHDIIPNARYYLMASDIHGYLWTEESVLDSSAEPSRQCYIKPIIKRYDLGDRRRPLGRIGLEAAVFGWLTDLSLGRALHDAAEVELEKARFITAIRNAIVTVNTD